MVDDILNSTHFWVEVAALHVFGMALSVFDFLPFILLNRMT